MDDLRSRRYVLHGGLMLIMTAVLIIMLLSYERGHALLVGPLTMAVSAVAGGDHYIQMYDSRMNVAGLTTIFGLAFPCAFYLKDQQRPVVLSAVLAACVTFFASVLRPAHSGGVPAGVLGADAD
ncbi:MAG: hypothetical protein PUD16_01015 [bacterium]|nr:hypothetical protein [bacterium]